METFAKLFGSLLALVYRCFDRVVILGHLPLLTRPENIVHFFRDIHHVKTIDKEALRQRTNDYHRWVEAFAKLRKIPLERAETGVRKEDYVHPQLRRMERRKQFLRPSPPPRVRLQQMSGKLLPKISRHVANEAMHRCLRNAVAYDRIHRLSHRAERRLVNSGEIQLRFSSGQRVHRKLALHEREQPWHGRRLPFQLQRRGWE